MLVGERMTRRPITVDESATVNEALELMHREHIRRLPVVDKQGRLVGIVSELDLLKVSPSPATSLSIYEIPYLLAKIKMRDIMTRDVITVTEDTPLEEAARIMADNKIGGLPVMRGDRLVGIITETDIFKIFLEMLGGRETGVRLTMEVPEKKGILAKITAKIAEIGGNILALGTLMGEDPSTREVTVRVSDVTKEDLVAAIEELGEGIQVRDIRLCTLTECA
ncbi:MAG TPA: CBS domain-containing protein [Anaerolineales bacterium]|nr:CBS domain-containing protein [Anaerolineae bacterium]HIP88078.1 CBS domain-containing protein [Anaerolineales bacterium]